MADELVRMDHVSKFYGRVQALDDVTLNINHNEIVGLLGDNGAGKSTLIKVLPGVVPLTTGQINIKANPLPSRAPTMPSLMPSRPSTRTPRW